MLVLTTCAEDTLHSSLGKPLERGLKLATVLGVLELKEIEIALFPIEMEAVEAIIVASEG